jgi:MSHA biogenesis protein MshI
VSSLLHKFLPGKGRNHGARVGIALGEESFALALVRRGGDGKPAIEHCAVHAAASGAGTALKSALDKLGASRAAACAVVDGDDYQVVQIEAPEVLPSEMRAAIRWRLRDAISFKVDDASVDIFEIPEPARRAQNRMLFAVAARAAAVERIATTLKPVARGFNAIDIPELCLRNLSTLLPQDEKGVAVLAMHERYAQLVITRQGMLYVTRRIDTGQRFEPHGPRSTDLDPGTLALELQRSLDYYETHYDQAPIGDLIIAPGGERAHRLADALKNETSLRVSVLDVRETCNVYKAGELVTDWLSLMALGAALRSDGGDR